MAHAPAPAPVAPANPFALPLPDLGQAGGALPDYLLDAFQRSVLFLEIMRERGNMQADMASQPMGTVLRFEHEILLSGRSLAKPINYYLARIIPPEGTEIDPKKRPVVVVDPRAGQAPGIGGFKADSEIGDSLRNGHPVYFIGFTMEPEPGQQFLDVVEGQVKFFERIVEMHPGAPRPMAIGNCQAGYQTLMVAMLRPDLFGPCLVAGSPMSYWQGVHGKNPMRYSGGLLGGSWLTALTADVSNGKFDGTWLILNFDNLNPANWLWGKQYDVYANVDTEAARFLEFEKWWGDFIQLNGDELQFLVDNMFVGDKLTRNQLKSTDGRAFDLRNIASPIIVFTSFGDNISPPPQTLGWIVDLYRDVDDIRASGRTIVYCLNQEVGHLAIFVSSKVGAKEDEEFVQMMDVIDCLPPGLYEMIISPRPADVPEGGFVTGNWMTRFETRTLDDIRAVGRNSEQDDRAFAAAARLSELNHSIYRTMMQPLVRAVASQPMAEFYKAMNPLRLSYTMFADSNPWMKGVQQAADQIKANRRPAAPDNPFLAMQQKVSDQIVANLDAFREARDQWAEQMFFAFYGSPVVQGLLGMNTGDKVRELPAVTQQSQAIRKYYADAYRARVATGGPEDAFIRAVLFVLGAERSLDQRSALMLNAIRKQYMTQSLEEFKTAVRDQFYILLLERERAVEALSTLVAKPEQRAKVIKGLEAIFAAAGGPTKGQRDRIDALAQQFGLAGKKAS